MTMSPGKMFYRIVNNDFSMCHLVMNDAINKCSFSISFNPENAQVSYS